MAHVIGTDEAGYGPNLGPLTICGTRWEISDVDADLYKELQGAISKEVRSDRIPICDSKKVYSSSGSIEKLESAVLAILNSIHGRLPNSVDDLLTMVGASIAADQRLYFCGGIELPLCNNLDRIEEWSAKFVQACDEKGISLTGVACQTIFPAKFNRLVGELGNKAEVLSSQTLCCISKLSQDLDGTFRIICDKHGGRSKYTGMLNQYLTDQFVHIDCESRSISRYHWREKNGQSFEISFQSQGESFCPTALSSMIAKYVREVCMECWNRYWDQHIPGIKPTKGYPVDAKRFKAEIEKCQMRLEIQDDQIWRIC